MSGSQIKNHLQKTGGTMLGDLILANPGKLIFSFNSGANGVLLKLDTTHPSRIFINGISDLSVANIICGTVTVSSPYVFSYVAKISAGNYTGDGNDVRTINVGVNNFSLKTRVTIIVKSATSAGVAVWRAEMGQGDLTSQFAAVAEAANQIQGLDGDTGFVVGTHAAVNTNGVYYRYIVLYREESGL